MIRKNRKGSPLNRLHFFIMPKSHSKKYPWFKLKGYPHIGLPLENRHADEIAEYVQDEKKIASHSFKPFIYKEMKSRKYRRALDDEGNRLDYRVYIGTKARNIYYVSHFDAQVYSYYAHKLSVLYENELQANGISECVTAYRSIPTRENPDVNKCSAHFAKEAFDLIRDFECDDFRVLVIDISNFFDSLDHNKLKKKWTRLLDPNSRSLPLDHYNIFKSLTRISYINENQIFNEFKNEIWVRKHDGGYRQKRVSRKKFLYNNKAVAFCKNQDFQERVLNKGLVKKFTIIDKSKQTEKPKVAGIPQGTPISAVLANIYMMEFDKSIKNWLTAKGGIYRRYSDDMFFICRKDDEESLLKKLQQELKGEGFSFQNEKTQNVRFYRNQHGLNCEVKNHISGQWNPGKKLSYLGFDFDGKRVLLKSQSLAKYYRKMKLNVRRGAHFAKQSNKPKDHIYKRPLYKKFSVLGAGRKRIYVRDKLNPKKWVRTERYDWGNYLSYVYLAAKIMDEPVIKRQVRRHQRVLKRYIDKHQAKVDAEKG